MEGGLIPDLPDGAIVNGEILITSYYDRDGQMKYVVATAGNMNLAQALGLLVLGGFSVFSEYKAHEPFEPDEEDDDE